MRAFSVYAPLQSQIPHWPDVCQTICTKQFQLELRIDLNRPNQHLSTRNSTMTLSMDTAGNLIQQS